MNEPSTRSFSLCERGEEELRANNGRTTVQNTIERTINAKRRFSDSQPLTLEAPGNETRVITKIPEEIFKVLLKG